MRKHRIAHNVNYLLKSTGQAPTLLWLYKFEQCTVSKKKNISAIRGILYTKLSRDGGIFDFSFMLEKRNKKFY